MQSPFGFQKKTLHGLLSDSAYDHLRKVFLHHWERDLCHSHRANGSTSGKELGRNGIQPTNRHGFKRSQHPHHSREKETPKKNIKKITPLCLLLPKTRGGFTPNTARKMKKNANRRVKATKRPLPISFNALGTHPH